MADGIDARFEPQTQARTRLVTCTVCEEAFVDLWRPGRVPRRCPSCQREYLARYSASKSEKRRRDRNAPLVGTTRPCARCSQPMLYTTGPKRYCAPCRKEVDAELSLKNRERNRHKWRRTRQRRYANDEMFRLNLIIGNGIRHSIRRKSKRPLRQIKSRRTWLDLVDYTLEELKSHLERQFVSGMSWHNFGEWHVDHIVPLASFNFETPDDPDFKAAWALTNLRPLWGPDNLKKSYNRTHLL